MDRSQSRSMSQKGKNRTGLDFQALSKCHATTWTSIWPFKSVTPTEKASVQESELYHSRCILKVRTVATCSYKNSSEIIAMSEAMV